MKRTKRKRKIESLSVLRYILEGLNDLRVSKVITSLAMKQN